MISEKLLDLYMNNRLIPIEYMIRRVSYSGKPISLLSIEVGRSVGFESLLNPDPTSIVDPPAEVAAIISSNGHHP